MKNIFLFLLILMCFSCTNKASINDYIEKQESIKGTAVSSIEVIRQREDKNGFIITYYRVTTKTNQTLEDSVITYSTIDDHINKPSK